MAGANSIFDGDKLLTTPNNDRNEDLAMFEVGGPSLPQAVMLRLLINTPMAGSQGALASQDCHRCHFAPKKAPIHIAARGWARGPGGHDLAGT